MTKFGRGTGPELQYWYARLCSILQGTNPDLADISDDDYASIEEGEYFELLRIIAEYPDVTSSAYKSMESSVIMFYLINITDQLVFCLDAGEEAGEAEGEEKGAESVAEVDKDSGINPAQVALLEAVRQVLGNGMRLLGIVPVDAKLSNGVNGVHV